LLQIGISSGIVLFSVNSHEYWAAGHVTITIPDATFSAVQFICGYTVCRNTNRPCWRQLYASYNNSFTVAFRDELQ